MKTLHFETIINAPREKVWDAMLSPDTYSAWTSPFDPTSRFQGNWEEGSLVRFIGNDEKGALSGMISHIEKNAFPGFMSIKHVGVIKDGVEYMSGPEADKWTPAMENYTFVDEAGATKLLIDVDVNEEFEAFFKETWPKALEKLKDLAERKAAL